MKVTEKMVSDAYAAWANAKVLDPTDTRERLRASISAAIDGVEATHPQPVTPAGGEVAYWQYGYKDHIDGGAVYVCKADSRAAATIDPERHWSKPLFFHPPVAQWSDTPPTESGWYWHSDGEVTRMHFVFTRPGHAYLCTEGEPYGPGQKRNFPQVQRMGGHWSTRVDSPSVAALNQRGGA